MKNRMLALLVIILLAQVSGCNKTAISGDSKTNKPLQKSTDDNRADEVVVPFVPAKKIQQAHSKTALDNKRLSIAKEKIYLINNERFSTKTALFNKGQALYNLNVNQSGTIKGSVVVVLVNSAVLSKALAQLGEVNRIAKDTYRINFSAQQNVLRMYQRIKKMPSINVVEMEIDYTPKSKNKSM
jgi:hypothetical protein